MKARIKRDPNIVLFLLGITIALTVYFAWGFWTISYKAFFYKGIGFLLTIVAVCLYSILTFFVAVRKDEENIARQLLSISIIGAIVFLLLFFSNIGRLTVQKEYLGIVTEVLWMTALSGCSYCLYRNRHFEIRIVDIKQRLREHKWLYLLLIVTVVFMIEPDALQFKWDGLLYYLTCCDLNIASLSSLAIYGHIAQTYGILNGIGSIITGNTAVTMISVNCILMLLSICAFYGVLRMTAPGRKEWEYALFTAVYAWSPFLLGMAYYHNLDFFCQCFFPIVLYFLYQKKWVYFVIAALLFCFTKEPAIVIYGTMCVGVVITDWFIDAKDTFFERIKRLFTRKKYYLMVLPGVLWIVTYGALGPWSAGEGGFSIDWSYIPDKLKVLYILNFNWVFSVAGICGFFFLLVKKKRNEWIYIAPILCSQVGFTVFSCLFKTVNHPRYTDTNQVALYSIAVILLCCFGKKLSWVFSGVMSLLLLISSYLTIDPISKACFPQCSIGTGTMIATTDTKVLAGDGMIYNRQMLGLERALNMALEDSLQESENIFFSAMGNNAYFFDGMSEVGIIDNDYRIDHEYWDVSEKRRIPAPQNETQTFTVYQVTEKADWNTVENVVDGKINLIYLPAFGEQYADEVKDRYTVLEEETYNYRGWILNRICFVID